MEALRILIPTDFSPQSEFAYNFAILLSKKFDLELHVLHVIQSANDLSVDNEGNILHDGEVESYEYEQLTHQAWEHLLHLNLGEGPKLNTHLKLGPITETILNKASEIKADLIVMGTKGEFTRRGVFRGIETQFVVRKSGIPVITLTADIQEDDLKHVVLASHFRYQEKQNLEWFLKIINAFEASVEFLYVSGKTLKVEEREKIEETMQTFAGIQGIVAYEPKILAGYKVFKGIQYYSQTQQPGMIAIGTHGRPGWMKLIWPSISERVATGTNRPVFTFHFKHLF